MRSRRWVLALTGSIVPLLLALVWVETQRSRAEHPAPSSPPAARPAMVLHDHVERVRTRRGEVSWQFQGDRIEVLDSGDYLVYGLKRGQYFSNQVVEVEFTAERARFEARTQNILVRGQVEVSSLRGLRFSADSMAWFEAEGKMYAPTVRQVEWRDPKRPGAPPATLQTGRLFYFPREQRLELPDRLTGSHQGSRIEAAAGSASLDTARLQLAGPAQVAVMASLEPAARRAAAKRMVLAVGQGGVMAFNGRSQSTAVKGDVSVSIPADGLTITCAEAGYSGEPQRLVRASGNLLLRDPSNYLRAPRATVDTIARLARFGGPVELNHRAPAGEALRLTAPRLTFWYGQGRRRALAEGGVTLASGTVSGRARRVDANLERQQAVLTGAVDVTHRPLGGPPPTAGPQQRARYEPVRLTSGRLVHRFGAGNRSSLATGRPHFYQADRQGTARSMRFAHDREILVLEGGVRVWTAEGERARCARLTYDLQRDEMQIETPAAAEFYLREPS